MHPLRLFRVPCYLILAVLASACGQTLAVPPLKPPSSENFLETVGQLLNSEEFFTGGDGQELKFDADAAQRQGISDNAIKIAQESAQLTNEVMLSATTSGNRSQRGTTQFDPSRYPALDAFFKAATDDWKRTTPQARRRADRKWGTRVKPQLHARAVAWDICGNFASPLPSRAAEYLLYPPVADPSALLESWGYHEQPWYYTPHLQNQWTRPRNHRPDVCHIDSFRDHATFTPERRVREQNYVDFPVQRGEPGGEPNPEVNIYEDPYYLWTAYNIWWHELGPGGPPEPPTVEVPVPTPTPPPPPPPAPPPSGFHYNVWRGGSEAINKGVAWAAQRFVARFQTISSVSFNAGGPSNGAWANSATIFVYSNEAMTAQVASVFVPDIADYGETVAVFPASLAVTIGRAYWLQVHTGQLNVRILLYASRFGSDYLDGCAYWHDLNASTARDCTVDLNLKIQQ